MNTSDIQEKAEDMKEQATEQARDLKERAQRRTEEAKSQFMSRARDLTRTARERGQRACQVTDDYVHENTWTTLAIAAGVGVLTGVLLMRMKD